MTFGDTIKEKKYEKNAINNEIDIIKKNYVRINRAS
jgi:hypothetical protein